MGGAGTSKSCVDLLIQLVTKLVGGDPEELPVRSTSRLGRIWKFYSFSVFAVHDRSFHLLNLFARSLVTSFMSITSFPIFKKIFSPSLLILQSRYE